MPGGVQEFAQRWRTKASPQLAYLFVVADIGDVGLRRSRGGCALGCPMSCGPDRSRCCRCGRSVARSKPLPDRLVLQRILFMLYTGSGGPGLRSSDSLWDDVLATVAGLAGCRGVRPAPSGVVDAVERSRAERLVPGVRGCFPCAGERGHRDRSEPGRPGQDRFQAPPDLRRLRDPPRGDADRHKPPRHHPAHPTRPRDTTDPRPAPTPKARRRHGGPRLRSRQVPHSASPTRDPTADSRMRHPEQQPTGLLARGTDPRPAPPTPRPRPTQPRPTG